MRIAFGVMLGLLLLGASPAHAYLLEPEHDGFFLRFQPGLGVLDVSEGPDSVGGFAGTLGFALGGTVAKNLILHGEFVHQTAFDPKVDIGGMRGTARDSSVVVYGMGPGLTYYFMPANVYLSGSVLLSWLAIETPYERATSDASLGFRASIGKEWWVSRDWGLGMALVGNLANISSEGASLSAKGISLAFSATLN